MFVPDKKLENIIIDSLKEDDKSISSLHRALKEEGIEVHRLILTGYLRAMEDLHVLKAKEIPPSKVYSMPSTAEKDIYELVGEKCNLMDMSKEEKAALAVFTLQRLLRRPVFLEEIEKTGLHEFMGSGVIKISSDERMEIKRTLTKRGIKTRYNDPAYQAKVKMDTEFDEVLADIIIEKFKLGELVIETKQTTLGV